ncbi:MAG TPA: hypothetical protein VF574_17490 [Allosphingosinicella sp.]|jgi:hypothetical protein
MPRFPLVLAALALLAPVAPATAQSRTTRPSRITETSPRLHFLYSYPAQAAAIPPLAARLRREGLASLAEARRDAAAAGRGPRSGPDQVEQVWEVSANTPDLLALGSSASTYQDGSAHGYSAYETLIWDRARRRAIELSELFSDRRRGITQLMTELCARLNVARAQRWREQGDGRPPPMRCPDPEEVAIAPGSEHAGKIESFHMIVTGEQTPDGYAGGSYEVEALLSPAIRALIRPDLRRSFKDARPSR